MEIDLLQAVLIMTIVYALARIVNYIERTQHLEEREKAERERLKKNSLSASDALLRLSFTGHKVNETDYLYSGGMREGV